MKKSKGQISFVTEKNPDGTHNVLRVKTYLNIQAICLPLEDAKKLIEILNKQNNTPHEKL